MAMNFYTVQCRAVFASLNAPNLISIAQRACLARLYEGP